MLTKRQIKPLPRPVKPLRDRVYMKFTRLLLQFPPDERKEVKRIVRGMCVLLLCAASIATAAAGDHGERRAQRERSHNYILERQEGYQVQGVPTSRLIIGKREIDIYRDGQMFERNNLVGVKK